MNKNNTMTKCNAKRKNIIYHIILHMIYSLTCNLGLCLSILLFEVDKDAKIIEFSSFPVLTFDPRVINCKLVSISEKLMLQSCKLQ